MRGTAPELPGQLIVVGSWRNPETDNIEDVTDQKGRHTQVEEQDVYRKNRMMKHKVMMHGELRTGRKDEQVVASDAEDESQKDEDPKAAPPSLGHGIQDRCIDNNKHHWLA